MHWVLILQNLGTTKLDYLKISWGFVLYPMVISVIIVLITFYAFNYKVWIKIGDYNIFSNLEFFTFLNWFVYLLSIFIGWWLIVYLSMINNTSAASIQDHAEFIKSIVYPDKIFSQSRNTIHRAKSALFKLLKKDH